MKISARTRKLVDVDLPCGCSIVYDFEWVPEPSGDGSVEHALEVVGYKFAVPMVVPAPNGGFWESLNWHPGEVIEDCGKEKKKCSLRAKDDEKMVLIRKTYYLAALEYLKQENK